MRRFSSRANRRRDDRPGGVGPRGVSGSVCHATTVPLLSWSSRSSLVWSVSRRSPGPRRGCTSKQCHNPQGSQTDPGPRRGGGRTARDVPLLRRTLPGPPAAWGRGGRCLSGLRDPRRDFPELVRWEPPVQVARGWRHQPHRVQPREVAVLRPLAARVAVEARRPLRAPDIDPPSCLRPLPPAAPSGLPPQRTVDRRGRRPRGTDFMFRSRGEGLGFTLSVLPAGRSTRDSGIRGGEG